MLAKEVKELSSNFERLQMLLYQKIKLCIGETGSLS